MLTTVEGIYKNGKVELLEHLKDVQEARVLITFLDKSTSNSNGQSPKEPEPTKKGKMMRFGMFPQLLALTDEDFKAAEFHGDPDDGLDWFLADSPRLSSMAGSPTLTVADVQAALDNDPR